MRRAALVLAGGAVAGVVGWIAAPWVAMVRHGTLDERTVAAWSAEHRIPRPRRAPDCDPQGPGLRVPGARSPARS